MKYYLNDTDFNEIKDKLPKEWKHYISDINSFYRLFNSWCGDEIYTGLNKTEKEIHDVLGNDVNLGAYKQSKDGKVRVYGIYHLYDYNGECFENSEFGDYIAIEIL